MEQKLDQILSIVTSLQQEFASFQAETASNFDKTHRRLDRLDERTTVLEHEMSVMNKRLTALEQEMISVKKDVASLNDRMSSMEQEISALNKRSLSMEQLLTDNSKRISNLEQEISALNKRSLSTEQLLADNTKRISNLEQEITALAEEMVTYFGIVEQKMVKMDQKILQNESSITALYEMNSHMLLLIPSHFNLKSQVIDQQNTLMKIHVALRQHLKMAA